MIASLKRQVGKEILDELAEDDPRASRARRDLRRINWIMRSAGLIASALTRGGVVPRRILELGAGDGSLMLCLARRQHRAWPGVHVTLLDRQQLVSRDTREQFARLGWTVEAVNADVLDWATPLQQNAVDTAEHWDAVTSNLFVHHFDNQTIRRIFEAVSRRTDHFVACEPRRDRVALLASRLVALIGAGAVTREDAVLSVRAGFNGRELSRLWPGSAADWAVQEARAGAFSHRFLARRLSP